MRYLIYYCIIDSFLNTQFVDLNELILLSESRTGVGVIVITLINILHCACTITVIQDFLKKSFKNDVYLPITIEFRNKSKLLIFIYI